MKFELVLRSVPNLSVVEKHDQFVRHLKEIPGSWGIPNDKNVPCPDMGSNVSAILTLKSCLGKGLAGRVIYRLRSGLTDCSECDDIVNVEFDPRKQDFSQICHTVFPRYVEAFDAYYGYITNEDYIYEDFSRSRNINYRRRIVRMNEVNFFSFEFARIVFQQDVREILSKALHLGMEVREITPGILLSSTTHPLTPAEGNALNTEARGQFAMI